jgi:hypothetical protein
MGLCHGKPAQIPEADAEEEPRVASGAGDAAGGVAASPAPAAKPGTPKQPKFPFYLPSPLPASSYKGSPANSSVASTPARGGFKRPFPPPSPAKHIRALLARRHGSVKLIEASILKNGEPKLGHRGCSPGRHMHLRQWPSHGCGGQHALVQGCE